MEFNLFNGKKAEMTTKQIVGLVILILSFSVILFLFFRLDLGKTTNKEICHNSVILKSNNDFSSGSLDCRTTYVCVSGERDCEKINPDITVKVLDNLNKKEQIMKSLAEEMADCWWMFGEGNAGYVSKTSTSKQCAICSVVDFDSSLEQEIGSINYAEFINYLKTTKKENSQTYYNYLYGNIDIEKVKGAGVFNFDKNGLINLSEKQSVLTGMDANWGVGGLNSDDVLSVFLVQTSETSSTKCDEFITKA